jgi:Tol biopolymer transport system component
VEVWAAVAVGVAAVLVITYGPFLNPRNPVAEAAEGSMRTEQVWTGEEGRSFSRLSPDGKRFLYTDWSTGDFHLKELGAEESRQITDKGPWSENRSYAETAAISPDGKQLAAGWYNDEFGMYELRVGVVPDSGDTDDGRLVFRSPTDRAGYVAVAGWLSDSKVLFVHAVGQDTRRLAIADVTDGGVATLKDLGPSYPSDVVISPDRRWIAHGVVPDRLSRQNDIVVLAADGSGETVVVKHPSDDYPVAWTPDGSQLLFRSTRTPGQSLWAVPMSEGKGEGSPQLVSPDFPAVGSFGISAEGDLYYKNRTGSVDVYEARIDVESGRVIKKAEPVATGVVGDNYEPVYSPNGRWMAYMSHRNFASRTGSTSIVVRDLGSGQERDLLADMSRARSLAWSLDSSSLLFPAQEKGRPFGAYRIELDGAEKELLFESRDPERSLRNLGWMANNREVYYRASYGGSHWIHSLETGEEREILKGRSGIATTIALAPGGGQFAGLDFLRDDNAVELFTFDPATQERRRMLRFELSSGEYPSQAIAWTPSGRAILFWRPRPSASSSLRERNVDLWVAPVDGGAPRKSELAVDHLGGRVLSVHPDGERITFSAGDARYEVWKLSNFMDRLTASN